MQQDQLQILLNKYYDGDTSPQEELLLHLALLEEPADSPYKNDLALLEGLMEAATILPNKRQGFKLRKTIIAISSSVAVAVLLFMGISFYQQKTHQSYMNGEPIAQQEVDMHAEMAFRTLASNLSNGMQARIQVESQLSEANKAIENAWSYATNNIYEEEAMIPASY